MLPQVVCQQMPLIYINEKSYGSLCFDLFCFFPQMEVGSVQNTAAGMPDKQKELDAKVRAIKSSVTVSMIQLFSIVLLVCRC